MSPAIVSGRSARIMNLARAARPGGAMPQSRFGEGTLCAVDPTAVIAQAGSLSKPMLKFFNSDMAELAHQLTISPRRLRVAQLRGIDELLGVIESAKAYPFDFVCFHITGYRKRGPTTGPSIPGQALVCDLVTMAEVLSRQARLTVAELGEPCRTHVELANELQVSTKTIRRWRNRGLMGLRLIYEDGVNRLAFCRRSIDRFTARHGELVARGASFKQLTAAERKGIVQRARELLSQRPIKLHAAAKVISQETGRAVETIRYTLRRYDQAHGESALFTGGARVPCPRHEAIWSCHQKGETIETIAAAFDCQVGEIEGILREVQVRRWADPPLTWVHNELFDAPNADEIILEAPQPTADEAAEPPRIPKDLPPYLRSLYLTPLLSRQQEADLFRRYNYLKYKAAKELKAVKPAAVSPQRFELLAHLMEAIDSVKQRIVRANLRLVVSIAKRHLAWSTNFFEIISDGNMSLMRAVERFDYARGNKFSTYATWAITKNYARSVPEQHYHAARYVTGQEGVLEAAADHRTEPVSPSDRRRVRELIARGMRELTEREREVVSHHFGLGEGEEPVTLEQLGQRYGVTKERVRQIEQKALSRLREVLTPSLVDAFGG